MHSSQPFRRTLAASISATARSIKIYSLGSSDVQNQLNHLSLLISILGADPPLRLRSTQRHLEFPFAESAALLKQPPSRKSTVKMKRLPIASPSNTPHGDVETGWYIRSNWASPKLGKCWALTMPRLKFFVAQKVQESSTTFVCNAVLDSTSCVSLSPYLSLFREVSDTESTLHRLCAYCTR